MKPTETNCRFKKEQKQLDFPTAEFHASAICRSAKAEPRNECFGGGHQREVSKSYKFCASILCFPCQLGELKQNGQMSGESRRLRIDLMGTKTSRAAAKTTFGLVARGGTLDIVL